MNEKQGEYGIRIYRATQHKNSSQLRQQIQLMLAVAGAVLPLLPSADVLYGDTSEWFRKQPTDKLNDHSLTYMFKLEV